MNNESVKKAYAPNRLDIILLVFLMCIITVLSLIFYQERILYNDTAASLWDIFRKNSLNVTTNRFVSIFSQFLPLIAYKLGASLKVVMILYSLNFILVPILLSLISIKCFKETNTAWSILLFCVIMSKNLFYYPVSEFRMGLCFLLFYAGYFQYTLYKEQSGSVSFGLISLFFIPVIVFSHPLSVLVFSAWLFWQVFLNGKFTHKISLVAILIAISYATKKIFFYVQYDADKTKGLENFKNLNLTHLFDVGLGGQFISAVKNDYFLIPFLIIILAVVFIRLKKIKAFIVFLCILLSFVMLIAVSFKNEPYNYYIEHMYQPFSFFIALAVGRYFKEAFDKKLTIPVLAVVFIISVNKIYYGHNFYSKRLQWFRACFEVMETKNIKKTVVGLDRIDGWSIHGNWLTWLETLMLSSLDNPKDAKTITIVWNEDSTRKLIHHKYGFINVSLDITPVSEVPSRYFKIGNAPYTILSDVFGDAEIRRLVYLTDSN